MEKDYRDTAEEMTAQNETLNTPAQTPPFDLKRQAYEDTKQAIRDFNKNHPGAGKKIVGLSLLAASAVVLTV